MDLEHKGVRSLKGAREKEVKLFGKLLDEARNYAFSHVGQDVSSYMMALLTEVAGCMANGMHSEGDEWARDVIRFFKDEVKVLDEHKDEIEEEFSRIDAKKKEMFSEIIKDPEKMSGRRMRKASDDDDDYEGPSEDSLDVMYG